MMSYEYVVTYVLSTCGTSFHWRPYFCVGSPSLPRKTVLESRPSANCPSSSATRGSRFLPVGKSSFSSPLCIWNINDDVWTACTCSIIVLCLTAWNTCMYTDVQVQVKSVIRIRNYMRHNNILDPHGFVAFVTDQGPAVRVCSTYFGHTAYEYAARTLIIRRTSMQYVPWSCNSHA